MEQLTLRTNTITVIFKDGTTATFENAVQWEKHNGFYVIIFYVDNHLLTCDYDNNEVATIILGYVDIAL